NLASDNSVFGGNEKFPVAINASSTAGTVYRTDGANINYDDDSHKTCNENSAQGLYVRVYADKVVILGRDFNTGKWVPEACCVLQNNDVSLEDDLVTMQYGETRSNNYVVNPEKRTLSGAMSNDTSLVTVSNDGKITASNSKQGTTTVNVSVMPSNTHVLKRLETDVRVVDVMGNNHYLVGSFNNWGEGYRMNIVNDDVDVLSHSLELLPGTYEFRIDSFDKELGAEIVINDSTTEELTLANSGGNITLVATGGNYTFTYNKATKKLTVDCKPFTQDDTDANDLFACAERKDPYLDMSKEVYTFGEPLYATTQGGKWIGIFKADADIATANSAYLIDTTGKDAKVFDLKTGLINLNDGNLDPGRTPGAYKAVLFGTDDKSQVLDTEYFEVVNGNNFHYNATNLISSNKKVYSYGQEVYVSACTDRPDLKPWVAVVEHGAKVNDDTLKYWYYLPIVGAGDDAYVDSSNQNLISASEINNGIFLEPGKYDIYLYRTSSYSSPRGFVTIEVAESPATTSLSGIVTTDKDVYGLGEDIITTVYTGNTNSWVGIYKGDYSAADPADATQHIAWYKTFNNDGFSSVLQRMDECSTFMGDVLTADEATPGTYTAILFKDVAQYDTILSKHVFTIDDSVKGKILQGAYKVDSLTDGFANGRVAVELDESAYNYINSGSITLYWADAQGKPLADYMPFGEEAIKNTITVFDLDPYVFIPEEAAGFVAYISYNGTESEYGRFIKLPDNCQTYTGLDTGMKNEFQIVADLQLGTDINYDSPKNVEAFFTDVANNSPSSTGIFVAGDSTYNGYASEFDMIDSLMASVESSTGKTLPPIYVSHGDSDGTETFVDFVNSHGGNVTADKMYYSLTVDGYKYIFMAMDVDRYSVSSEQINWLDAEL
ncbi:MAG: hypothetical protein II225_02225, partial [Ruminococcus sp.]|nr:hypothetical protein [Ruminococcus sp.]